MLLKVKSRLITKRLCLVGALRAPASSFRRLEQPPSGCSQVPRLEQHALGGAPRRDPLTPPEQLALGTRGKHKLFGVIMKRLCLAQDKGLASKGPGALPQTPPHPHLLDAVGQRFSSGFPMGFQSCTYAATYSCTDTCSGQRALRWCNGTEATGTWREGS